MEEKWLRWLTLSMVFNGCGMFLDAFATWERDYHKWDRTYAAVAIAIGMALLTIAVWIARRTQRRRNELT